MHAMTTEALAHHALPGPDPAPARRHRFLRLGSFAVSAICFLTIVRLLPLGRGIEELKGWVEGLGATGLLVFGVLYVVAALLFVPGGALTLAAGGVFGLFEGLVVVSLASTTAAALGYLIARHLARAKVEELARRNPRFDAVDKAIGERGWRIVFLLRLSPAFPFSVSNYLYGLTAVRFVPLVLASWIAMLPGTFLYVYLGHAGAAGIRAASGDTAGGRTLGEWILLGIGLAATVAVTVYVTRIALKALRSQAPAAGEETLEKPHGAADQPSQPSLLGTVGSVACAALFVGATACATMYRDALQGIFGPPAVALQESYDDAAAVSRFDHSPLDGLLKAHVDAQGMVDYRGLGEKTAELESYLDALASAPFDELSRDGKLALLINAYNAFTLRLILEHYPVGSIKDLPIDERWDAARWPVAGKTLSLNQIEHEEIRGNFREPRIHFALVCAAKGCPPLRGEAYDPARLEEQLADQTRIVHEGETWFRFQKGGQVVHLTRLYDWYGGDFEQVAGSVLDYAATYSPALARELKGGKRPRIEWLEYDWSLNDQEEP